MNFLYCLIVILYPPLPLNLRLPCVNGVGCTASSISMKIFGAGRLAPEIFRAGGGVGHEATCVDQWPAFS